MDEYLKVLALAMMPAMGNLAGGLFAIASDISERTLSFALHAAAGVALAVVSVELFPRVLKADTPWMIVLAFAAGGGFFVLIDYSIDLMQNLAGKAEVSAASLAIFIGVAVDLLSDGVMVGTGSTITFGLGLLLALAQVPANVPAGFATIAAFERNGVSSRMRLLLTVLLSVSVVIGATLGYWLLRGQAEIMKLVLLAFTSGILITVVVEEMIPAAHEGKDARFATAGFVASFALFTLLSVYF
jgi:zinc transporter, ZIP family